MKTSNKNLTANDDSSTISNLPNGGNLAQNDVLPIVRGGANFKATYNPSANTGIQSINSDATAKQTLIGGKNINITDNGNGQHTIDSGNNGIQSINADTTPDQKLVAGTNVTITNDGNGQHTINATFGGSGIQSINNDKTSNQNLIAGTNVTITDDGKGNHTINSSGSGGGILQITSPSGSVSVGGNLSNTTIDSNIDNQTITQNSNKQLQVDTANIIDNNTLSLSQNKTAQINLPNIVDNKTITVQNNKLVASGSSANFTSATLTINNTQNTINLIVDETLSFYYNGENPIVTDSPFMYGNTVSNVVLKAKMLSVAYYVGLITKPGVNPQSGGTYGVYRQNYYKDKIGEFAFPFHDGVAQTYNFSNDEISFTFTETGQACPNYSAFSVITYTVISATLGVASPSNLENK